MGKAFLFDLNGTMVDDMYYHAKAWDELLKEELGTVFEWDLVVSNMYGKNREVLIRLFGPGRFTEPEIEKISYDKEKRYQALYKPLVKPIDGLLPFLSATEKASIKMAIGSAAIPENIDFVIDALQVRKYFTSIVSAANVVNSKPDPETFLMNAMQLGVSPSDCIVFEDAPKGVEAAERAGMLCVVITTMHAEAEFYKYKNIIRVIKDYPGLAPESLVL
ncbi:MAG: HAD family phosphatase [Bacteroidota bacterium]